MTLVGLCQATAGAVSPAEALGWSFDAAMWLLDGYGAMNRAMARGAEETSRGPQTIRSGDQTVVKFENTPIADFRSWLAGRGGKM